MIKAFLMTLLVATGILVTATVALGVPPINRTVLGKLAVKGYDCVSYFEKGKAEKGTKEFSHKHGGPFWRFSSPEHLKMFKEKPKKYAPPVRWILCVGRVTRIHGEHQSESVESC